MLGLGACSTKESDGFLTNQETIKEEVQEEAKQEEVIEEEIVEETKQEEITEEVKEEPKKEIDPEILKTYKYWVVFYNPDGTEFLKKIYM